MQKLKRNRAIWDSVNELKLVIGDSAYAEVDTEWQCSNIFSPFNRLYLVESGEAILFCGQETVVMKPGMAYLIPARTTFSYRCDGSMTKLFFHFNLLKPDHYDLFQSIDRILIQPLPPELLTQIIHHFFRSTYADGIALQEQIYRLLYSFTANCHLAQEVLPSYSRYVAETIRYILENLSAGLQVESLAQRLFISKSYLEKCFRREVGVSVGRYIDDQLMIAAQHMLDQTNDKVSDIAQTLGYTDPYYFSRRFKQLCGIEPLRYRRCLRLQFQRPQKKQ